MAGGQEDLAGQNALPAPQSPRAPDPSAPLPPKNQTKTNTTSHCGQIDETPIKSRSSVLLMETLGCRHQFSGTEEGKPRPRRIRGAGLGCRQGAGTRDPTARPGPPSSDPRGQTSSAPAGRTVGAGAGETTSRGQGREVSQSRDE